MRIVSWNIHQQPEPWYELASDDALDFALVQEAKPPPPGLALEVHPPPATWAPGRFRTAVVSKGSKYKVRHLPSAPVGQAGRGLLPESRPGTVTAAEVTTPSGEAITLVSVYAAWENPAPETSAWDIFADASAHRIISDVSALIGSVKGHRIIVAGDFNCLHGYGENKSPYWKGRYDTIFARMEALGLPFVGPQHPNGAQADPWPDELPRDSKNVPTFRTNAGSVSRQLDFVFASGELVPRLKVSALNSRDPKQWGPSDHCRVEIVLADT